MNSYAMTSVIQRGETPDDPGNDQLLKKILIFRSRGLLVDLFQSALATDSPFISSVHSKYINLAQVGANEKT